MLSTQSGNLFPFVHIYDIISLFAAESEEPQIGISGKELIETSLRRAQLKCFSHRTKKYFARLILFILCQHCFKDPPEEDMHFKILWEKEKTIIDFRY